MRWMSGRRGGGERRVRGGSNRGRTGPRILEYVSLQAIDIPGVGVWVRTAIPPGVVETTVREIREFGEDVENSFPD